MFSGGIFFHSYAEESHLYMAMSPDDTGPIDSLFKYIIDLKAWKSQNFLQLNKDKTEILIIDLKAQRETLATKIIR